MPSEAQSDACSTLDRGWQPAPSEPRLSAGALHVWRVDLDGVNDDLLQLLSPDERARAARFAHDRAGRRWGRAHGLLRALLGNYLQADPRALAFTADPHGKPRLREPGPSFNLSHSQSLALFAFSASDAIGVDVEVDRRPIDEVAIAARTLGTKQAKRLQSLEPTPRRREFLRLWARHEAELKCIGTGIGRTSSIPVDPTLWVAELDVGPHAAAAVALERSPGELRCWEMQPDAS